MTIQERIDCGRIIKRFKEDWKEGTVEELVSDYPFFEKWIKRVNWYHSNNRIAILKSLTMDKNYHLYMYSNTREYSISVSPKYMSCGSNNRVRGVLEDWNRGNDFPDGDCCEETFVHILFAILHDELIPYDDSSKPPIAISEQDANIIIRN